MKKGLEPTFTNNQGDFLITSVIEMDETKQGRGRKESDQNFFASKHGGINQQRWEYFTYRTWFSLKIGYPTIQWFTIICPIAI